MPDAPPPMPPEAAASLCPFVGTDCVAAVSGGRDSVAMLRMLAELGGRPLVAHVVHGLRDDDEADADFVESLAGELGLRFVARRVALGPTGESIEEQGRRLRYDALARIAFRATPRLPVLTAHTADDQAETVLFRIVRGTGLDGLAGMRPQTTLCPIFTPVDVVRPLLTTMRSELTDWLTARGFGWRDDATNADAAFTRNRIRHEVLPLLRTINPQVDDAIRRLALIAAEEADQREFCGRHWLHEVRSSSLNAFATDRVFLAHSCDDVDDASPTQRLAGLRELWKAQGWPLGAMTHAHWRRLLDSFDGDPRRDANGGVQPVQFDLPAVRVRVDRRGVTLRLRSDDRSD